MGIVEVRGCLFMQWVPLYISVFNGKLKSKKIGGEDIF